MDNAALQKIRDTIASSQQASIIVGKNPTVDQMGAALALYLTLESQGKKVSVLSPTEPIVELSSLVGIDKVKTSNAGTGGDLVVSFPYREGEIEKVSYTIDDGFLNIVVKAGELGLTFGEQDVIFKHGLDVPSLLFAIGIQRLSDVEGLFPQGSIKDVKIVNVDNSNENEGFGAMVLVSPKFSSLSEQVADLILNLGYEIDIDVSQNLLAGITAATNNFQNPQTSYLAFEIAAILMKRGALRDRSTVRSAQAAPVTPFRQRQPQIPMQSQQPQRRDDRQDRREAIRDALKAQPQQTQQPQQIRQEQRQDQRNELPRSDRPEQQTKQQSEQKPPSDWLTPKVYKGSTAV